MNSTLLILGIIILIIGVIGLIGTSYMMDRNKKVYKLRIRILDLCEDYNKRHIDEIFRGEDEGAHNWLYRKLPSYEDMLISFKPLKLETYITEEDYQKLIN